MLRFCVRAASAHSISKGLVRIAAPSSTSASFSALVRAPYSTSTSTATSSSSTIPVSDIPTPRHRGPRGGRPVKVDRTEYEVRYVTNLTQSDRPYTSEEVLNAIRNLANQTERKLSRIQCTKLIDALRVGVQSGNIEARKAVDLATELISKLKFSTNKPESNVFTSLMSIHILANDNAGAIRVWENMRRMGITPDVGAFTVALSAYNPGPQKQQQQFGSDVTKITYDTQLAWQMFDELESLKLKPTPAFLSLMLNTMIQAQDSASFERMLDEVQRSGALLTAKGDLLELAFKGCADFRIPQRGFELFEAVCKSSEDVHVNPSALEELLRLCILTRDQQLAWKLFAQYKPKILKPILISNLILVMVRAKSRAGFDRAFQIADQADMLSNYFVLGACINGMVEFGDPLRALKTLDDSLHSGLKRINNSLLMYSFSACMLLGETKKAWQLFDLWKRQPGVHANNDMICSLLNLMLECGSAEDFARAVKVLRESGVRPNSYIWTALIKGYDRFDTSIDKSLSILNEMRQAGEKPTHFTLNSLLAVCLRRRDAEKALQVYHQLKAEGIEPTAESFFLLINTAVSSNQQQALQTIRHEFQQSKLSNNLTLKKTFVWALGKVELFNEALALFDEMANSSDRAIISDLALYNSGLFVSSHSKDLPRAVRIIEQMSRVGVTPNTKSLQLVVYNMLGCGKSVEECKQFVRDAQQRFNIPDEPINYNIHEQQE